MQNNRTTETENRVQSKRHSPFQVGVDGEELKSAIKSAAFYCPPGMTSAEAAAEFYESNGELVEPFVRTWAIEKIAKLIGSHRAKTRREANSQLVLEDMMGFKWLPEKLELNDGEFVPRAKSTISGFRRWARDLRAKDSPALAYANKAIALMAKYTKGKPHITWEEVCQKEAGQS
jgi:hypothetical protein